MQLARDFGWESYVEVLFIALINMLEIFQIVSTFFTVNYYIYFRYSANTTNFPIKINQRKITTKLTCGWLFSAKPLTTI